MASEEAEDGLGEIRDEVFRKIGRNLLIFQDIERMLKFLVAFNGFTVTPSSDVSAFERAKAPFEQQTLGQIKSHFVDRVLLGSTPESPVDEKRGIEVQYSFAVESDGERVGEVTRCLDALIAERNELVHHFLPNSDLRSMQSLSDAAAMLDEQMARALDVHGWVKSMIDVIRDHAQDTQRFLDSPEGQAQIDLWLLQSSSLVARLVQVADEKRRRDGWTVLDRARSLLREEIAAALPTLMSRYGVRSLKDLLVVCQVFDVLEESTSRGGTRTIYRPKSFEQK
jgi:hypothetical protein